MTSVTVPKVQEIDRDTRTAGLEPRKARDRGAMALLDTMADIQDEVLERQRAWLSSLDLPQDVRERLYKQFCVATGQMIHELVAKVAA